MCQEKVKKVRRFSLDSQSQMDSSTTIPLFSMTISAYHLTSHCFYFIIVFFFIVQLCTRGLNHVKKFLDNEERKRGGGPAGVAGDTGTLTQAGHRGLRSRESFQLTLRHPISKAGARDSGYTTSDGSTGYNEKRSVKYTS